MRTVFRGSPFFCLPELFQFFTFSLLTFDFVDFRHDSTKHASMMVLAAPKVRFLVLKSENKTCRCDGVNGEIEDSNYSILIFIIIYYI